MKLEGICEGAVYASGCRSLYTEQNHLDFRQCSRLPSTVPQEQSFQRFLQTNCLTKAVLTRLFGSFPTVNIWPVDTNQIYGSRGRSVFRSRDAGETWDTIHQLPPSSGPMGILPTGFYATDDTLLLGEYPLDGTTEPRLLESADGGDSWTTIAIPDARHIHAVTVDPFTGDRWITTGDSDEESMIARVTDTGLDIVGTGSQLWRAVDLVFTPNAVLWGMDCPYVEKNRIVKIDRDQIGTENPSVETLHTVSSPVYFSATRNIDGEQHVFFSTAIEPATTPEHSAHILHSSSVDGFETWTTLVEHDHSSPPLASFVNTNAYIFLAAHPERGLFINPYNTDSGHGEIENIPINRLQELVN